MKLTTLAISVLSLSAFANTPTPEEMKLLCEQEIDASFPYTYVYAPVDLLNAAKSIQIVGISKTGTLAMGMSSEFPDQNIRSIANAPFEDNGRLYFKFDIGRLVQWQPKGASSLFPFFINLPTLEVSKKGLCLSEETFGDLKVIPLYFRVPINIGELGVSELLFATFKYQLPGKSMQYNVRFKNLSASSIGYEGDILLQDLYDQDFEIQFKYLDLNGGVKTSKWYKFVHKSKATSIEVRLTKEMFSN